MLLPSDVKLLQTHTNLQFFQYKSVDNKSRKSGKIKCFGRFPPASVLWAESEILKFGAEI